MNYLETIEQVFLVAFMIYGHYKLLKDAKKVTPKKKLAVYTQDVKMVKLSDEGLVPYYLDGEFVRYFKL